VAGAVVGDGLAAGEPQALSSRPAARAHMAQRRRANAEVMGPP